MKNFNWVGALSVLGLGLGLIGVWLALLANLALAEVTRGAVVFLQPTPLEITVATFAMLLGVGIASIQVAAIIEKLSGSH